MKCQRCSQSAVYIVDVALGPARIPLWGVQVCERHRAEIEGEGEVFSIVAIDPEDSSAVANER